MNKRPSFKTFVSYVIVMMGFLFVAGSVSAARTIDLNAAGTHPGAGGKLVLTDTRIEITAENLKPDSVYTVWFVNMKPAKQEAGAGSPPYMFKTDADGSGKYAAALKDSPFGRWEQAMIVLHPDGNPENMSNMVEALSAEIPEKE